MSVAECKEEIKRLIDSTNDQMLLQHWQKQLEWDVQHPNASKLSNEEWILVEEGISDYEQGNVISLTDFISKRQ